MRSSRRAHILLGAVLAGAVLVGEAKAAGAPGWRDARMIGEFDVDGDGKVMLGELLAEVSAAFAVFDENGDGRVTPAETAARRKVEATGSLGPNGAGHLFSSAGAEGGVGEAEARAHAENLFRRSDANGDGIVLVDDGWKRERDRERRGRNLFRSFDADEDGRITPEELLAELAASFERLDADGDGEVSRAEANTARAAHRKARKAVRAAEGRDKATLDEARRLQREARPGPLAGRLFGRVDADRDGVLTLAELEAAAAALFRQRDEDRDGAITPAEMSPLR